MKPSNISNRNNISIIIPCRDEKDTVLNTLKRVKSSLEQFGGGEIVIVDDFSTDGTLEVLKSSPDLYSTLIQHKKSFGKGAAVCSALKSVTGDIVLIQDADSEYWPEDYPLLFNPILKGKAEVVYGTRPFKDGPWIRRLLIEPVLLCYSFSLRVLTSFHVQDIATCYKVFRSEILADLKFKEPGFSWDIEVTLKLAELKDLKFAEVPIRYSPRTKAEGKKLSLWVGVRYLWLILKCGFKIRLKRKNK